MRPTMEGLTALDHQSARILLATVASGTLLLFVLFVTLFVLPYLLVAGL